MAWLQMFYKFCPGHFFFANCRNGQLFESCWSSQISAEFPDSFMQVLKLLFQICIWHFRQVVLELIVLVQFFCKLLYGTVLFLMQILHSVVLENLF